MSSLFISGPMQAVEDRCKPEKHGGSKIPGAVLPGCPIPNLRRRTSVANHNTWHSNVDSGLYNGTNDRRVYGVQYKHKLGTNTGDISGSYHHGSNRPAG